MTTTNFFENVTSNTIVNINNERAFVCRPSTIVSRTTIAAAVTFPLNRLALLTDEWEEKQKMIIEMSKMAYTWAVDRGIAKEQARAVLPEGLTISKMYMNGTLRSWVHYIELRTEAGTQKEHREIAKQCAIQIAKILPLVTKYSHLHEVISGE